MNKIPLSVFIITKNEADRIATTIKSVINIAEEIIVIDSGSTDNTCKISQELGAKVFFNQWNGFGEQKVFGEQKCLNPWILNIDADEEVSQELAEEIRQIIINHQKQDLIGYKIKIVNKFRFEEKPNKFAYYYNQLRLYQSKYAGFSTSAVHDSVLLKDKTSIDKIGQCQNIIYHQSFRSFKHWIEKINFYSELQAMDNWKKGKNVSTIKIITSPILAFFKALIIRRYICYGSQGIIYSLLFAFSRFAKMIKIRELFLAQKDKK
ncbi:MAG: glycosyltransferase family 2 protein [Rickettsiales bacterium]|jgi:glycosyltransferase involved in cell wall biosynthesis|nr:glycosyltransferase family 2 protein [Rickettsiales bacterium]